MEKQIVGVFAGDFEKIIFYEIMDNYNEFTILRKQGTNDYYLYNNDLKAFSPDKFHIIKIPDDKKKYEDLINIENYRWCIDAIFFWADSKFVTEFGLPGYDKLLELYDNLIDIRYADLEIERELYMAREEGFFTWLMTKIRIYKITHSQRRLIKRIVKEFKVIW